MLGDLRARRNHPGGFWVAKDDPRAADEAVTGQVALRVLRAVALQDDATIAYCTDLAAG